MNKKVHKIFFMLIVVMITLLSTVIVYADSVDVPDTIRIGLYYGSKSVSSLKLSSPGGIEIGVWVDGDFEVLDEVSANETITITRGDSSGSVDVSGFGELGSKTEYPYFKSIEYDGVSIIEINGKQYRGNVEVRRFSDSDMTVINHLSMQEYLYGVVPREIGGNSPLEAVKAQAIVARTYATKNYGRREGWGFDLYPTVDDQAYGGYEWENANSNLAVDETNGQVVVYNGELIGGYYFSTSGGYTESSENVWGGKLDYLKAVPDPYEPEIDGNTTWEVEYTAEEIESKLRQKGIDIGEILALEPISYTDAGRVLELKIIGTDGETTLTKSKTREYLGLKSQWYTVNDDAPEVKEFDYSDLPNHSTGFEDESYEDEWWMNEGSTEDNDDRDYIIINPDYIVDEEKLTVKEEKKEMKPLLKLIIEAITGEKKENSIEIVNDEETDDNEKIDENEVIEEGNVIKTNINYKSASSNSSFVFRGRGWGHAIGMSQNGAKGMAEQGFSCEEIIEWYYSGVEVVE